MWRKDEVNKLNNKKQSKMLNILVIIGILDLIVTIAIFAILRNPEGNSSQILGFCFMIFAEIVLFGGLIALDIASNNTSKIILRTGCGFTLAIYSFLVFASSLIFIIKDTAEIKNFWVLQIILFFFATILFTIFYTVARHVLETDNEVLSSLARVNEMADNLKLLETNHKYGKQLFMLGENLSFTDTSSFAQVDDEIEAKISKIELLFARDENSEEVEPLIEEIALLIKKRKVQVRNQKVGGL